MTDYNEYGEDWFGIPVEREEKKGKNGKNKKNNNDQRNLKNSTNEIKPKEKKLLDQKRDFPKTEKDKIKQVNKLLNDLGLNQKFLLIDRKNFQNIQKNNFSNEDVSDNFSNTNADGMNIIDINKNQVFSQNSSFNQTFIEKARQIINLSNNIPKKIIDIPKEEIEAYLKQEPKQDNNSNTTSQSTNNDNSMFYITNTNNTNNNPENLSDINNTITNNKNEINSNTNIGKNTNDNIFTSINIKKENDKSSNSNDIKNNSSNSNNYNNNNKSNNIDNSNNDNYNNNNSNNNNNNYNKNNKTSSISNSNNYNSFSNNYNNNYNNNFNNNYNNNYNNNFSNNFNNNRKNSSNNNNDNNNNNNNSKKYKGACDYNSSDGTIKFNGRYQRNINTGEMEFKPDTHYIFLITANDFNGENKECDYSWKVKIKCNPQFLGVGLADKNKVRENNYKFYGDKKFYNGVFCLYSMYKSDLKTYQVHPWSAMDNDLNNYVANFPVFKENLEITMTYKCNEKILIFSAKNNKKLYRMEKVKAVGSEGNTTLTPCIIFFTKGDSVQVSDLFPISNN